ncbi:MAG: hypothetical protein VYB65_14185 [Myxococcota bacterium]|nr:hypothetical protein [Myxococcota bacterium]
MAVDDDPLEATTLRILMLVLLGLTSACAGWDGQANLDALDDQELEALCGHFYDLAGGEPTEEQCVVDGAEYTATLGSRSEEIAACKAKTRPACATQLLVDCVESRQGSICASVDTEACRAYVDCELGT